MKLVISVTNTDNSDFDFCIAEHSELPVKKSVPMKEETIANNWNQKGLRLLLELL